MEKSGTNPQIKDEFAPLETLIMAALRRYGEYQPSTVSGEAMELFLDFANSVVEDIRQHPYWNGQPLDYYTSITDTRPIPDLIVQLGLCAHYAIQQLSAGVFGSFCVSQVHRVPVQNIERLARL